MLALSSVAITFENASKITCDISLGPGDICAITGPSGVGKSTLLLALAGFRALDNGDVTWQGQSFMADAIWDRPVSLLFQSDNLFGHLSARRNISFAAHKSAKKQDIATKIDEIAAKLEISSVLDKACSALSGGQQQRVGLARAVMAEKPILLLDEPFSALDEDNRHKALALVKDITAEHQLITMIVTHDKTDIAALGAKELRLQRQPL